MTTLELIEYIKKQLDKNISKDLIIPRLFQAGWRMEDIEDGFKEIEKENNLKIKKEIELPIAEKTIEQPILKISQEEIKIFTDKYHESTQEVVSSIKNKEEITAVLDNNISTLPITETPKQAETNSIPEIKVEDSAIVAGVEPYKVEIPKEDKTPISGGVEFINAAEGEDYRSDFSIPETKIEEIKEPEVPSLGDIESQKSEVLEPTNQLPPIIPRVEQPKIEIIQEELKIVEKPVGSFFTPIVNRVNISTSESQPINQAPVSQPINQAPVSQPITQAPIVEKVENIINAPLIPPTKNTYISEPISTADIVIPVTQTQKLPEIKTSSNQMTDIIHKNAMISSYSQDLLIANHEGDSDLVGNKKHPLLKWIILSLIIILIGCMVFVFVKGDFKISGLNFSVIKKDPKTIILAAPTTLSNLQSYKTETNINISSPAIANITSGLVSGKVATSKDRDSITINTKGQTNYTNGVLVFDYLTKFNISTLKNNIVSQLKYDGSTFYATVPDLSEILDKDAPAVTTVSLLPNQLGLIVPEFSPSVQNIVKNVDIYNMLSEGIPPYVKNQVSLIFNDFIKDLNYIEKDSDVLSGVEVTHYELTADRPQTKKFLNSLVDLFITKLTDEQKKNLDEAVGASSISSFDVWVGKNDDNLYKFKFTLNAPLSRVLGLNDSGIAGNEVKLDWETRYYDINVPNDIQIKTADINIEGFIKKIKDNKIKNIISGFKPLATALRNSIGTYGLRTNPLGSCSNPNPGSLFSPLNHAKGADVAIGGISTSMNSLLLATNGVGLCYSTSKDWALAAPVSENNGISTPESTYFYCIDSTGSMLTLTAPITSSICK